MVMDKRWEQLDNPEANEDRKEALSFNTDSLRPNPIWPSKDEKWTDEQWKARWAYDTVCQEKQQAKQEQDVLDQRAKIEEFAQMIADFKLRGEEIEKFAEENDIPGICSYDGIENWMNKDIVGDAIQWAASNHNC